MVDESWSAFRFLRKLGNGLNRDGRLYYRIGYGIRLGNVSSSPFRATELREHRASSAPALRNRAGASAGKPSLPAFTSPPASNTRRFSASPVVRDACENQTLAAQLKGTITSPSVARYARHERIT